MKPTDPHLEHALFGDERDPGGGRQGEPVGGHAADAAGPDHYGPEAYGPEAYGSDDYQLAEEEPADFPGDDGDGGRHDGESPRRRRRGRRWIALLVTLVVVVAAAGFAVVNLAPPVRQAIAKLTESNDYTGTGHGSVTVVVHPGDSGAQIAQTLVDEGVVKTTKAFTDAAAENPSAAGIQPGTYRLRKKMSATSAISMLLDPANREVHRVTIPEGLRAGEIFAALAKGSGGKYTAQDYQRAAKHTKAIGLPPQAHGKVEGFLFPATYDFQPKENPTQQLSTMVNKAVSVLNEAGVPTKDQLRVLTIASLVEAEARRPQDRPKVARVIANRLKAGMPLQMDSTIHYLSGTRGKAGTTNAQRNTKSPYNTYLNKGLPPGPIDSPGAKSIQAAVHPAPGAWLYFVTVNPETGATKFATTLAQHNHNVKQFQAWCGAHRNKC
ncbi:MAG TPA: endolytic transglycosylase MltG [Segeticoccus sp.]|uniref:endolytic transglycosylase MltG n=1 Tax=Segeticoccus sp. TaxID=2706531 RepID=UPI002D7FDAC6|nr:endolytic transglycosylase MltG [Segeticoccus sp.]HET8599555.1 endolytic transglycosylase MltG [Segeticoccus sp.]